MLKINKFKKNEHILNVCDDCNETRKSKKEKPKTNYDINNQKLNVLKADFRQMYQQNEQHGTRTVPRWNKKQVSSNKE